MTGTESGWGVTSFHLITVFADCWVVLQCGVVSDGLCSLLMLRTFFFGFFCVNVLAFN